MMYGKLVLQAAKWAGTPKSMESFRNAVLQFYCAAFFRNTCTCARARARAHTHTHTHACTQNEDGTSG